jgi:hypothetical protein
MEYLPEGTTRELFSGRTPTLRAAAEQAVVFSKQGGGGIISFFS